MMRKSSTIAAAALAVLALAACRQEPTAKPVDTGTEVTAQEGATAAPDASATTAAPDYAATPAATTTPTPEATASPTP